MSAKVKGFLVTLDQDLDEDKAKWIRDAILCLRGVASVVPSERNGDDILNRERVKRELQQKLLEVVL